MTETRPSYAPFTSMVSRDEWEAAQYAEMQRVRKAHSTVRVHLEFKDGVLIGFSYEPIERFSARRMDNHRA